MVRQSFIAVCLLLATAGHTQAQDATERVLSQAWHCVVSGTMRNEMNYRTYYGGGFDGRFIFRFESSGDNNFDGGAVAERWLGGSQNLVEYRFSGFTGLDSSGHAALKLHTWYASTTKGDGRIFPDVAEGIFYIGDGYKPSVSLLTPSGDQLNGTCTLWTG